MKQQHWGIHGYEVLATSLI